VEIINTPSKTDELLDRISSKLRNMIESFRDHCVDTKTLFENIKLQAYKEKLTDFELNLLFRHVFKNVDIPAKEKARILEPLQEKKAPRVESIVFKHEVVDHYFPFTLLDETQGKKMMIDIIKKSKKGVYIQEQAHSFIGMTSDSRPDDEV